MIRAGLLVNSISTGIVILRASFYGKPQETYYLYGRQQLPASYKERALKPIYLLERHHRPISLRREIMTRFIFRRYHRTDLSLGDITEPIVLGRISLENQSNSIKSVRMLLITSHKAGAA